MGRRWEGHHVESREHVLPPAPGKRRCLRSRGEAQGRGEAEEGRSRQGLSRDEEGQGRERGRESPGSARAEGADDRGRAGSPARSAGGILPAARGPCHLDEGRRGARERRRPRFGEPHRGGGRLRDGHGAAVRESPGRERRDDHPRIHRHPRPSPLLGLRALPRVEVGVRGEPRVRRDDGVRPVRPVARRLRAGRGR